MMMKEITVYLMFLMVYNICFNYMYLSPDMCMRHILLHTVCVDRSHNFLIFVMEFFDGFP